MQDVKSEFGVYEGKLFGNVKGIEVFTVHVVIGVQDFYLFFEVLKLGDFFRVEGINVAASHPLITSAVAVGLGLVALKSMVLKFFAQRVRAYHLFVIL